MGGIAQAIAQALGLVDQYAAVESMATMMANAPNDHGGSNPNDRIQCDHDVHTQGAPILGTLRKNIRTQVVALSILL